MRSLDQAAGLNAGSGFTQASCRDGWAIGGGSRAVGGDGAALFTASQGHWIEITRPTQGGTQGAISLEFAAVGTSISPTLFVALAQPLGKLVQQEAGAGALVEEMAAHQVTLNAEGLYQASPVITADGADWLVLEGADGPGEEGRAAASPYADGTVRVYRWAPTGWSQQGTVHAYFGPIGGCCGIVAESYTGSHDPDFALMGGGAADTLWFGVVSDIGGDWHAVPFDYGYAETTVVNAAPGDLGVSTTVDARSAAGGPTTDLYETYQSGVFRPATPPGPTPTCDLSALQGAADPGQLAVLALSKFACADGWALAIGTGAGFTSQVVGLFEAVGPQWQTIELDNGNSLGSDPAIYDIPLSLLKQLAAGLGPGVQPAIGVGQLLAAPALARTQYLNGVIPVKGAEWFILETPTGMDVNPGADAEIYRWSDSRWTELAKVRQVPDSLNYFKADSGWFEAVRVPGSSDPGFVMPGATPPSSAVLTDAGGVWHSEAYPHP